MNFDESNTLTEEQRLLAEELGIAVNELTLDPQDKDRTLQTPVSRNTAPVITLKDNERNTLTLSPNRAVKDEMATIFDQNLLGVQVKTNNQKHLSGLNPRRQTFQMLTLERSASRRLSA